MVTSLVPSARWEVVRQPLGERAVRFLEFGQHLGQVQVLHVNVCILEGVVETPQVSGQVDVVAWDLEHLVGQVLQQQCAQVILRVGRDWAVLVVQFGWGRSE